MQQQSRPDHMTRGCFPSRLHDMKNELEADTFRSVCQGPELIMMGSRSSSGGNVCSPLAALDKTPAVLASLDISGSADLGESDISVKSHHSDLISRGRIEGVEEVIRVNRCMLVLGG